VSPRALDRLGPSLNLERASQARSVNARDGRMARESRDVKIQNGGPKPVFNRYLVLGGPSRLF